MKTSSGRSGQNLSLYNRYMQPEPNLTVRRVLFVSSILLALTLSLAAKDFTKPAAHPAKTYSAHDEHSDEHVAIAADPYDTPEKAKIFSINFREHDILPIFFIITNDAAQPISIANMHVTLTTAGHAKLTPISSEDISRRLTNPHASTEPPLPIPVPHKNVKGTLSKKRMDEIDSSQFAAKAVEPHNTQSGFLFFDVEGVDTPVAGARIFVTGVNDAKGTELMYFEIPLGK
ncbi:MAG: hypothetical protein ACLQLC_18370 [Candidatus Sulfotelmatobacter sp.]